MMVLIFMGIVLLINAIASFAQPVKMLPILLLIASVAFFVTAMFYSQGGDGLQMATGVLWLVYSLLSFYMALGILLLVMKGKEILPLLIKTKA